MFPRLLPLLFCLVALVGCLQEGPGPAGHQLFHGQNLEHPSFGKLGDEMVVWFQERIAPADGDRGTVYDLWMSSLDGKVQRKYVTNWSDHWPQLGNADGRYFMTNERSIPSGGATAVVGSWIRLGPTLDEEARIEDVANMSPFGAPLGWLYDNPDPRQSCPGFPDRHDDCPQALLQRPPAVGQSYPTLYLWDGRNQIPIGADSGGFQKQIMGDGSIYCILGDKHTLSRLGRPGNTLDSLRDNVSSFSVSGDQHYVALSVTDGKPRTVIRDLRTGVEVVPARPNPSSWGGFQDATFGYSQNATASVQAEMHTLDLVTGEDTFVSLPQPLVNQASLLERKDHDEYLRIDSLGHGVFTGRNDLIARRVLQGPLIVPSLTPDEKYVIHVLRATSTLYDADVQGALMFQDADDPERDIMISPAGLLLTVRNGAPYFFIDGGKILAFWAHLGRASSDLYFADYQEGALPTNLRLVAQSIMSVSVSPHNIFGIVNVSQQDGVGDLIYRDLDKGTDVRYAQGVSDAAEIQLGGSDLSSTIHGRADSSRSGLWLTSLLPPVLTDGGTD